MHVCCTDLSHSYLLTVNTHVSTLPGAGVNNKSDTTERITERISNGHELHMRNTSLKGNSPSPTSTLYVSIPILRF